MKVTKVSVHYGRRINLGDYQSANLEITLEAEVEEHERPVEVCDALWEQAKQQVLQHAAPLVEPNQVKLTQLFAGREIAEPAPVGGNVNANSRAI